VEIERLVGKLVIRNGPKGGISGGVEVGPLAASHNFRMTEIPSRGRLGPKGDGFNNNSFYKVYRLCKRAGGGCQLEH
jgi:hypothetical protein